MFEAFSKLLRRRGLRPRVRGSPPTFASAVERLEQRSLLSGSPPDGFLGDDSVVECVAALDARAGPLPRDGPVPLTVAAENGSSFRLLEAAGGWSAPAQRTAEAITLADTVLRRLRASGEFSAILAESFGPQVAQTTAFQAAVDALLDDCEKGSWQVAVELRPAGDLRGHPAVYAAVSPDGTERIYLSADWVAATEDVEQITAVLLEELGHSIDRRINGAIDSPGDEGEWFSNRARGRAISESEAERIRAEDDSLILFIDGQAVAVECATGAVVISGSTIVGQTLTATVSDADGLPATIAYQWQRSGDGGATWQTISGATARTYTLTSADLGLVLRVSATYTDLKGAAESPVSAATSRVVQTYSLTSPNSDLAVLLRGAQFDPVNDTQSNAADTDLVGDASSPMFFGAYDAVNDVIWFRVRIGDPTMVKSGAVSVPQFQGVMLTGLDVNNDGVLDIMVGVDGRQVGLGVIFYDPGTGANSSPSTTSIVNQTKAWTTASNTPVFDSTNLASGDTGGTYRYELVKTAPTDIGTTGGTDAYLTFKVPFAALQARLATTGGGRTTGLAITPGTYFRFAVFTLTQNNSINGDIGGIIKGQESTPWSQITNPVSFQKPTLSGFGSTVNYVENAAPVIVAAGATATDLDNAIYAQGQLAVSFASSSQQPGDYLTVVGGANGITVSGNTISYNGTAVGTFTWNNSLTPNRLIVSFTGTAATMEAVNATMRSVGFASTSDDPGATTRTVSFVLTDPDGQASDPATCSVTVTPVNDAPVNTVPASLTVAEDTNLVIAMLRVSDADAGSATNLTTNLVVTNGTLTVLTVAGGATVSGSGTTSVTLTGSLTQLNTTLAAANAVVYRGALNFNGSATLTMTTSDAGNSGSGGTLTDIDTVGITVTAVNDPPVLTVPAAQTVAEDTNLSISGISVSDVDAASGTVTVTLAVASGTLTVLSAGGASVSGSGTGSVTLTGTITQINTTLAATNNVVYRGTLNFNGSDTLTVTANDNGNTGSGGALTDTKTVAITVTAVNDAPVNTVPASLTVDEDTNLAITTLRVSDVDAGSATNLTTTLAVTNGTLTVLTVAGGATVSGSGTGSVTLTGSLTQINTTLAAANAVVYRGALNFNGSATLTMTTSDAGNSGSGGTLTDIDTVGITVTAVNDPPVLTVPGARTVNEDTNLSITGISVADVDVATGTMTVRLAVDNGTLTVLSAGGASVSGSGTNSVTLTGTVTQINTTLAATNNVVYRGTLNFNGSDTLTVTANDGGNTGSGGAGTDTKTVAITVTPVDDPSVLAADTASVAEDHDATGNVLSNDSDVDNVLSVASYSINGVSRAAGSTTTISGVGAFTLNGDGSFTFVPVPDWNGSVPRVTYTTNTGASTTLDIAVTPVDDPSELAGDFAKVSQNEQATGNVLANDTDVDDALHVASFTVGGTSYAAGTEAVIAGVGRLTIGVNGNYTFTPVTNWYGSVPLITYFTNTGASANLAISVTRLSLPTVVVADSVTVFEDHPATGNVLGNDSDPDDVLSVDFFLVHDDLYAAGATATVPDTGVLKVNADGSFTFTPFANWNGSVSRVTYTTNTGSSSTLDITVQPVNDAPAGADATVTVLEDGRYTFTADDFGFTDPNDTPANSLLAVKITTLPAAGTLTLDGTAVTAGQVVALADITAGRLVFTPAANANGTGYASFTFQVQDDGGTANDGVDLDQTANTITVNVTSVNDAPAGTDATVTIDEDTGYTLTADDFGFSDPTDTPANSLFAVKIATLPAAGVLALNGTAVTAGQVVALADITGGKLVFTPAANASGTGYASFTFQVQDDGGTANGGVDLDQTANTITVNVTSVNDAPAGTDATVTMLEDGRYTFTANDFGFTDPNDTPANSLLAVKITTLPAAGALTLDGTAVTAGQVVALADITAGRLVFTPAANASGTGYASFTFQVQDGGGTANGGVDLDQSAHTITVNVTSVNDAPAGTDTTVTMLEDGSYTFTADDFGFTDPDDAPANSLLAVKIATLPTAGALTLDGTAVTAGQVVALADITGGKLVFTPAANANGLGYASFTFQVQDDGGTANDGVDLDQSAKTITVNVTSVNDAPAGTDATVTIVEDDSYTFTADDFGFTDPNDTPANSLLAVKIATLPAAGTLTLDGTAVTKGQVVALADITAGKLVYTPAANASGTGYASFTFQVQDNGGTANDGVDLDQTAHTITVNVTSVNDAPAGTDATVTMLEGGSYTFTVDDFGFTDPNDTPANSLLAVKIATLPAAGVLTLNGTAVTAGQVVALAGITAGKLVFTPAANASGAGYASFTFQVQDDGGTANGGVDLDQSANTITVNVTSVNDAPAGTDTTITIDEDTGYTFTADDFGFTDPNDTPANSLLAVKITTLPAAGVLTLDGAAVTEGQVVALAGITAGKLVFTPAANANGTGYASFTFQVQDDGGTANDGVDLDQSAKTITVNVTSVNDAPAGTDATITIDEDTGYTFTVDDFGFTDPDDTPANSLLAVKITTLPTAGTLTLDGTAVTAGQVVALADITAGKLVFTPAANASGTGYASFTFQVQDNGGTANDGVDLDQTAHTITVNVTSVNDAPTVTVPGGQEVDEGAGLSITGIEIDDIDAGTGRLSVTLRVTNGTLTVGVVDGGAEVSGSGTDFVTLTGTLDEINATLSAEDNVVYRGLPLYLGSDTLTVTVDDNGHTGGGSRTASDTVAITVNDVDLPSELVRDTPTVPEDTTLFGNVLANDRDADSVLAVESFVVGGVSFDPGSEAVIDGVGRITIAADGSYWFIPEPNWHGTVAPITYITNTDDSTTLDITVTPVNDPSVLGADAVSVAEDSTVSGSVLGNDRDVDDVLSVANYSINGVSHAAGSTTAISGVGSFTLNADGTFTFTPVANFNGSVPQITYTTNTGLSTTLDITVTPVDDPSVLAADTASVAEDTAATGNVLANDSDVDSVLSVAGYSIDGVPYAAGSTATIGGVGSFTLNADGRFTFTPVANWNGSVPQVRYTTNTGSSATLDITVTPVNDPTVAVDDTATAAEDAVAAGNVLANDSDPDTALEVAGFAIGGTRYVAGETATIAGIGQLTIDARGDFTFRPAADWNGTVPLVTYSTNTGASATLTITVTPVDDPSVLVADTVTVAEDAAATGNVLANDRDVDSVLSVASYSILGVSQAAGSPTAIDGVGTFTLRADGTFTFTPVANWNGTVPRVTYTTNTGSSSTLDITVTPVDDPSVLTADTASGTEDVAVTGNVLTNDRDPDDTLAVARFTVGGVSYAAGEQVDIAGIGSLSIAANGAFVFTPEANWNGTVPQVAYTTNTGSSSTLSITVAAVDDESALAPDAVTVNEDTAATGNVLTNDRDVDSVLSVASYSINGVSHAAGSTTTISRVGAFTLNANGSFTFTPVANWSGDVPQVTYMTNTGSSTTLDITVAPVDDAAALADDAVTVNEDTDATGNVLANDVDVDSPLEVELFIVNGDTYAAGDEALVEDVGTLTILADGSFTFTPDPNWNGTVPTVSYVTTAGDTARLLVIVTPVNDPSMLVADTASVVEDTIATGDVLANDSDVDDTLTVASFSVAGRTYTAGSAATLVGVGTLTIAANGTFTFTPVAKWNGAVPQAAYRTNTGSSSTLDITVRPGNNAPVITSNGGGSTAAVTIPENTTAVTTVMATDPDAGTVLTYSIAGGVDGGLFSIDPVTGVLRFTSAPDYESPLDADRDNVYVVTVQVSDGSLTATQQISVTVTNVLETGPLRMTPETDTGESDSDLITGYGFPVLFFTGDPGLTITLLGATGAPLVAGVHYTLAYAAATSTYTITLLDADPTLAGSQPYGTFPGGIRGTNPANTADGLYTIVATKAGSGSRTVGTFIIDTEQDGIPTVSENLAPAGKRIDGGEPMVGDANGDGILDSEQNNVATAPLLDITAFTDAKLALPVSAATFGSIVADDRTGDGRPDANATQLQNIQVRSIPAAAVVALDAAAVVPATPKVTFTAVPQQPSGFIDVDPSRPGIQQRYTILLGEGIKVDRFYKVRDDGSVFDYTGDGNLATFDDGADLIDDDGDGLIERAVVTITDNGIGDFDPLPNSIRDPYVLVAARPTATITMSDTSLLVGETSLVTFTFSEKVTGFTNADLTVENGTLTDVVSANGGKTWTATFRPASGIRALSNAITLNLAGVQTLTTGTAGNTTASVTYAIDTTQPITDLQIAVTNGQTTYLPGGTVTYTVTVTNAGPMAIPNARLVSVLPAAIRGADVSWTATYTGAGSTGPTSGTGAIDRLVTLASGGTAVYRVTAAVSPTATSGLATMFTISPPSGTLDTNTGNNAAIDADSVVADPALVFSSDIGCTSQPFVRLVNPSTGALVREFMPYEPAFIGGIRVATGDLTGDGIDEIIVAPGRGRAGEIRVFTQWGYELVDYRTLPFGAGYTSGVDIAIGDVTGDGIADIVASMSAGASLVSVFRVDPAAVDPVVNPPIWTLQPFGAKFAGGASVAVADVGSFSGGVTRNVAVGDGRGELIIASGAGMKATVLVYDLSNGTPRLVDTINPFGGSTTAGTLTLSAGRYDADSIDDIIVSSGSGSSAVEVYSGRIDDRVDLRLAAFTPFADTARKNAPVSAVGLDLDRNGAIDGFAFAQGLGGNAGLVRQTSRTGALLAQRTMPAMPLRVTAINNKPVPSAVSTRMATLASLGGTGSIAAKQAAFAAYAAELSRVNADGVKRLRR